MNNCRNNVKNVGYAIRSEEKEESNVQSSLVPSPLVAAPSYDGTGSSICCTVSQHLVCRIGCAAWDTARGVEVPGAIRSVVETRHYGRFASGQSSPSITPAPPSASGMAIG